jgi:hypothetical protein
MIMSVVTSVNTGRVEEGVALVGALAAGDDSGGLLDRVGDVRLDLLDCFHVDQGTDHRPGSNPSATFIAPAVSARRSVNAS